MNACALTARRLGAALALWSAVAGVQAQADEASAASIQQQRAQLARERAQVQAHYAALEQACRDRFFVNFCLREVVTPRREALARLRQQEIQMEEAERRKRQAEALARVAEKSATQPAAEPSAR